MTDVTFHRPVNAARLISELAAIPGVVITNPNPMLGRQMLVTVGEKLDTGDVILHVDDSLDQAVLDQITAVVNAHDGTPDPIPPTPDFGTDVPPDFQFQLANAVQNLRQYLALATPTAAQNAAALKTLIRVVLYLVRTRMP
jgi:hypothetical protein